ncbi:MAG TPA: HD domain-containing protein [Planctomycetota bacterium]|nr:HD domain-containing protein [Planctomycetota bacterium]
MGKRRTNIGDLAEGLSVEETYLVKSGSIREARNGKSYIAAELADSTGAISTRVWDARPEQAGIFRAGGYVRVRGFVETYQGSPQLVVSSFRPVDPADVDARAFLPSSEADPEEVERRLLAVCARVKDKALAELLAAFFRDEAFMALFRQSPAAVEFHHACIGGLMEHTVAVAESAEVTAEAHPELDRDMLVAGALLHDIGKVWELASTPAFEYTDDGRMLGHIIIGAFEAEKRIKAIEGFPEDARRQLLHLIASHHGQREYGSPVLPVTAEALALHHLDNLDAKIRAASEAQPEMGGDWSEFRKMLGTRIYLRKRDAAGS